MPITFAPGAWCAIDVVHTKADRVDAGISAYETLIEEARKNRSAFASPPYSDP